jgi:hypothetical protein
MNINRDLNSGAQTAMNIGNSYNSAGSQRTSDLLNVGNAQQNAGNQAFNDQLNLAGGYNQAGMSNLMQQDQIMNQIPQYWQNALASLGLPQQFLDQMQQDRARDTRTTVVDQGKK